jgi:hypothetical protein
VTSGPCRRDKLDVEIICQLADRQGRGRRTARGGRFRLAVLTNPSAEEFPAAKSSFMRAGSAESETPAFSYSRNFFPSTTEWPCRSHLR